MAPMWTGPPVGGPLGAPMGGYHDMYDHYEEPNGMPFGPQSFAAQENFQMGDEVMIFSSSSSSWVPGFIEEVDDRGAVLVRYEQFAKIIPLTHQATHLRHADGPTGHGGATGQPSFVGMAPPQSQFGDPMGRPPMSPVGGRREMQGGYGQGYGQGWDTARRGRKNRGVVC